MSLWDRWVFPAFLLSLAYVLAQATPAYGLGKLQGYVEKGGQSVVSAMNGTSVKAQRSYPNATVTVYLGGTLTPATIYSDAALTAKPNPFSADSSGFWSFYAADGDYDVRFSGGGIAVPWTQSGKRIGSGGNTSIVICANTSTDVSRLNTATGNIPAAGGSLAISGTCLVDTALTIPQKVALQVPDGAMFSVSTGITMNILGPLDAGLYRIFTLNGTGLVQFGSAANQWANTYIESAHPEWWGVNGNAAPYDTTAVQEAIDSHIPVVFSRHYYVTSILMEGNELHLLGRGYQLIGVSTTANTDYLFGVQCGYSEIKDLHVNANFNTNYKSAVRVFADASHTNPQFNEFDGLFIENALVGLVLGAHVNYVDNFSAYTVDTPYDAPLSESTFRGFRTWSVERAITANQPNGKVHFDHPVIVATKGNWSGDGATTGVYRYSRSYAILNVPDALAPTVGGTEIDIDGGSIVANDATAQIGIRGQNIISRASIWEVVGPHGIIEGDRVIVSDSMNAGGIQPAWQISATKPVGGAAVTGQLRFDRCTFARNSDGSIFVESSSPSFLIVLTDTEVRAWTWSHASAWGPLVRGSKAIYKGVRYRNLADTIDIRISDNTAPSIFTTADPVGNSMSTAADKAAKNGWTWGGGPGANFFRGNTVTVPTGLPGSIEVVAVAGEESHITSPTGVNGFRVAPNESRVLELWARATNNGNQIIVDVFWYKYDGTASATASTRAVLVTGTLLTINTWRYLSQYVTVPNDAYYSAIRLYTDNAHTAYFSGVRF
jgi:hypothetical protein